MASALDFTEGDQQLIEAVRRSRKLLHRRALVAAAAGAVPVPGLDWAVDAALLSRLIPAINAEFGLTPEQLDRLEPRQRDQVQKAVTMVGSLPSRAAATASAADVALGSAGTERKASRAARFSLDGWRHTKGG